MSRLYSLTAFCVWCLTALNAQTDLSLEQAIQIGLSNAYNVQTAQKQLAIAQNNNNYGEAGRYPNVSLNLNSQNTYSNINNPASFLNGAQLLNGSLTPSMDLNWVLYDGRKVKINKQRLELIASQQELSIQQLVEVLSQQIMRAYQTALVQQERLGINAEILALSREKITYVEARREYGQATEFDRLQIQDAYLNDSIQWILQKNNYELALANLGLSMGLEPQAAFPYKLSEGINYQLADYTYEELQRMLVERNQQLKVQRLSESLSQVEVELQRSNLMPRLSLNASISEQLTLARIAGRAPQIPEDWRGGSTFAGNINLALSYNIYNGGRIQRSIQNSQLRAEVSRLQTKDLERQLSNNLYAAWLRYENQKQVLALSQVLLSNAEKNLRIATERFNSGVLNFFDYRSIQINYTRSLNAVQDAYINAKNTELELWLAVGLIGREN